MLFRVRADGWRFAGVAAASDLASDEPPKSLADLAIRTVDDEPGCRCQRRHPARRSDFRTAPIDFRRLPKHQTATIRQPFFDNRTPFLGIEIGPKKCDRDNSVVRVDRAAKVAIQPANIARGAVGCAAPRLVSFLPQSGAGSVNASCAHACPTFQLEELR